MTIEQIDAKMEELQKQKKQKLMKQKEKELRAKALVNAKKRKMLNRIKYIVGGYTLKYTKDCLTKMLESGKLREQDAETINTYLSLGE